MASQCRWHGYSLLLLYLLPLVALAFLDLPLPLRPSLIGISRRSSSSSDLGRPGVPRLLRQYSGSGNNQIGRATNTQAPPPPPPLEEEIEDLHSIAAVKRHVLRYVDSKRRRQSTDEGEGVCEMTRVLGREGELGIQWMPGGSTNYNFRLYNKRLGAEKHSVFVKHAKDFVRGFTEFAPLSRERVWYEAEGIKELSKYLPGGFPRVYLVDPAEGLFVCEWLEGYSSLADSLAKGDVVSRTIAPSLARMIARYTASSYHPTVDPPPYYGNEVGGEERREEWKEGEGGKKWGPPHSSSEKQHQQNGPTWTAAAAATAAAAGAAAPHASTHPNQGHINFWTKCVFPPLLAALPSSSSSSSSSSSLPPSLPPSLTKPYLFPLLEALNRGGDLQRAICRLWGSYRERKQSLVHADLHCKNILVRSTLSLKVVDCEKYMSGPAGLDLGQFSANYVWYIAAFAVGADRRETVTTMEKALLSVWTAFIYEFRQTLNKRQKEEAAAAAGKGLFPFLPPFLRRGKEEGGREGGGWDTEGALQSILLEAQGFLGMWLLFLTIACPVELMEIWPPSARDTCQRVDREGYIQAAHTNLVCVAAALLVDYYRGLPPSLPPSSPPPSPPPPPAAAAADEAGAALRAMALDLDGKEEGREVSWSSLIETYPLLSREDPRRLLGLIREGIYYSPAMDEQAATAGVC